MLMNKDQIEAAFPEAAAQLRAEGAARAIEHGRLQATRNRERLDALAKQYMAANPGVDYIAAYKAVGGV
ncbi:hypothetical protein [uncultured Massilia sp.]|uniref:hypothetical protein n=1 Tax=uncultured Massilia sp. TaxID=169973 RepID=UPI0025DB8BA0|nr:hypothetical protein [uncultured Massilia sp.]